MAAARVLMQSPDVILADEPTASLGPELAETMTSPLAGLARDGRKTLIMAVHKVDLGRCVPWGRVPCKCCCGLSGRKLALC